MQCFSSPPVATSSQPTKRLAIRRRLNDSPPKPINPSSCLCVHVVSSKAQSIHDLEATRKPICKIETSTRKKRAAMQNRQKRHCAAHQARTQSTTIPPFPMFPNEKLPRGGGSSEAGCQGRWFGNPDSWLPPFVVSTPCVWSACRRAWIPLFPNICCQNDFCRKNTIPVACMEHAVFT